MANSSGDLYSHFYDEWERERKCFETEAAARKKAEDSQKTFENNWNTAYSTNRETPDFNQVAKQLLKLREGILSRYWDFWLATFVADGNRTAWNLAAVTLWNVCQGKKSVITKGLRHSAALLNDIWIWHCDILACLKTRPPLPHTPPITQSGLAELLGVKRYDINNKYRAGKLTTPDTAGNSRRWMFNDDPESQKAALNAFRKKSPQLIWPHGENQSA